MKQLMILAVALCLGACGGDTEPSFDTLPEGAGPPLNLSESASIATTLHALISSTNGQLFKVLPTSTEEEQAANMAKLCAERSVTLHFSTTPETGGTAGIALTGSVQGEFTGVDSSKVLLDLSGVFDAPFSIVQSGSFKKVQLTGNASLHEELTAASGAGQFCETPPVSTSLAHSTNGTASGVFAISGSSGGKVAYEYTISQPDQSNPPVITGTAVLVSVGVEVHCTVSNWDGSSGSSSCPTSAGMGEHCTTGNEFAPKVTCPEQQ